MMKKQAHRTPLVDIVVLQQHQPLLTGSYDGPANAPEFDLGIDELNITGNDDVTFSDDVTVDFSL